MHKEMGKLVYVLCLQIKEKPIFKTVDVELADALDAHDKIENKQKNLLEEDLRVKKWLMDVVKDV